MGLLARVRAVPGWVAARLEPLRRTLPWRAWARYNAARGNVLAGGGLVSVEQLTARGVLTTAGALGFVTLVLSGLGWISALREGVQGVFAGRSETHFLVLKLVDLLVLAAAGLAVLVSVALSVAVNLATDQVLDVFGIAAGSVSSTAVNLAGQLVLTLVDAVIFTLLFHRLAGVAVPLRDVAVGGFAASLGFTVLKLFGSVLLQFATRNRFLAAFGVIVTLLVWMNLVARVTLVGAALSATVAADRGHLATPDPAELAGVGGAETAL